jgi:hypothetical protein
MRDTNEARRRAVKAFILPAILVLACIAVAAQTAQKTAPKNEAFTDEDLKVEKIGGAWTLAAMSDAGQSNDPTAPVVLEGLDTVSGAPDGKFAGLLKINRAEINNRGEKAVRSLQLKWMLARKDATGTVLLEGVTPFFDASLKPGASAKTDIPPIFFNQIVKPLLEAGELHGEFLIAVGVNEVRFEDGSIWQRTAAGSLSSVQPGLTRRRSNRPSHPFGLVPDAR